MRTATMAALMQSGVTTMFGNLSLGRRQGWCSNATSSKLAMGAKNTFHVEVRVHLDDTSATKCRGRLYLECSALHLRERCRCAQSQPQCGQPAI